mgnify:CR=1 FL=1
MGRGAVTADEAVQGDPRRKVFHDEQPGPHVGGDNPRGKRKPQVLRQERQCGQFGPQASAQT